MLTLGFPALAQIDKGTIPWSYSYRLTRRGGTRLKAELGFACQVMAERRFLAQRRAESRDQWRDDARKDQLSFVRASEQG